ncbi:MAG: hypothetical protein RLZZ332_1683, partial [Actinomycetota bacterium]
VDEMLGEKKTLPKHGANTREI